MEAITGLTNNNEPTMMQHLSAIETREAIEAKVK